MRLVITFSNSRGSVRVRDDQARANAGVMSLGSEMKWARLAAVSSSLTDGPDTQKTPVCGQRTEDFLTSWIQKLAPPSFRGILGSPRRAQAESKRDFPIT
jgi:hypothetical protein